MKFSIGLIAVSILAAILLSTGAGAAAGVTCAGHDKVAAALGKGDPLVTAPDLSVRGGHQEKPGQVEVHDRETDVINMVESDATLVTGGVDRLRIEGGEAHHLTKGDVIVVPAGTPHWFKEVRPSGQLLRGQGHQAVSPDK